MNMKKLAGVMLLLMLTVGVAPAAAMGNPASEGMAALVHSFGAIFAPAPRAPQRKVIEGPMTCAVQEAKCEGAAASKAQRCERTSLSCMLTDNVWCDCVGTYEDDLADCQSAVCNPYAI